MQFAAAPDTLNDVQSARRFTFFGSRNTSRRTYIERNVCPLYLTLQSSPEKRRRFSILVHVTEFSERAQKKHLGAADEI